jgi:glycosyltransferase involved in cell wall biosynthesis
MFSIPLPQIKYADPWSARFADRLARLGRGHFRVAYYYEHPDYSTFRYRAYNMVQAMNHSAGRLAGSYFFESDKDQMRRVLDAADALVFCRCRFTPMIARWIQEARDRGKRVFFDIDDDIADLAHVPLIADALDLDSSNPLLWDQLFAYSGRLAAAMHLCDSILTTNAYLADRLKVQTGKPVTVLPNFLNAEQLDLSQKLFALKQQANFSRSPNIHFGYFSGTPTHNKDFAIAADALFHLMAADPRIRLRIAGYLNLPPEFKPFNHRIERLPLTDFLHLQASIAAVEWNLIPLQSNVFTQSKSDLKYFEAGIVGTLSIASPVPNLEAVIQPGENGFLARSFEWEHILAAAIGSFDAYPRMAEAAFADCMSRYTPAQQSQKLEQLFTATR